MTKTAGTLHYSYRASWITLIRPLTLTGSISPAIAGSVLAAQKGTFKVTTFLTFLAAALLVQMAVNIFNDYFDFLNGQDADKWCESGRSGFSKHPTLSQLPKVANGMLILAAGLGIWLAVQSSFWVLVIGTVSIVAGIYYSAGKRSLSSLGAGELVAAIFLGFTVSGLAYMVEGGTPGWDILMISVPYAALIAAMILVNNIRDMKKDEGFRCTIPITLGRRNAMILLSVLIALPYIWVLALILSGVTPWTASIALAAMPLAFLLRWNLRKAAPRSDEISAMKWSAYHHWVFGLLFVFGIWVG